MARNKVEMRSEYLNYLRFSVSESAASTFTQVEIDTNLNVERGVMMEIHSVELQLATINLFDEVPAAGQELLQIQVTRDSKTGIVNLNDSDVIALHSPEIFRSGAIGTDAGPLYVFTNRIQVIHFPLAIPYVKPSIFVGILGTDSGGAHTVRGRIGYTLRDITREDFLELLVALQ